jgi:hypothetical protein
VVYFLPQRARRISQSTLWFFDQSKFNFVVFTLD